jgi:solute carrier family 13 (sodium-dependent dicarboxylate transporter), member 2/3/5
MIKKAEKAKPSGYDKFINWKLFALPLGLLILILLMPIPASMLDVGVEYALGPKYVKEHFAQELFQQPVSELSQWQVQMVRMMNQSVQMSSFSHKAFLARDQKWCESNNIPCTPGHLAKVRETVAQMSPEAFIDLLREGYKLQTENLTFAKLSAEEQEKALQAGNKVKAGVAIVVFVVLCFVTEAIPLPMVAFCIGIIALLTGIVHRGNVAMLYWSDATWFIMGSLMFATAFVKTGVDKQIAMAMFGRMKTPDVKWVSLVIIGIIAPLTMFMSDHALAAMFLPIGILLYTATVAATGNEDPELAKMLMITIAMAANLGGSLAPSGAARNIIMMGYTEEMFNFQITFMQWVYYCAPFLIYLIPVTWLVINWRFKPEERSLSKAMDSVKKEISKVGGGGWTRPQIISLVIFLVMLFFWITESNLIKNLTGIRLGIGSVAVMGGITYVLAGITNWRDYQTKVDWGVVWLYAGAIIFGRVLVETGGAYWIALTMISFTEPLGMGEGLGLLLSGNVIVGLMTQLMADGPACAAVGPVTLSMAGIVHPGTSMIPFAAMGTSIASSFAYCLVIGTPPNAIVYASGYLNSKDFLRVGVILWFTNMAGLMLLSATYWRWMGFPGLPAAF